MNINRVIVEQMIAGLTFFMSSKNHSFELNKLMLVKGSFISHGGRVTYYDKSKKVAVTIMMKVIKHIKNLNNATIEMDRMNIEEYKLNISYIESLLNIVNDTRDHLELNGLLTGDIEELMIDISTVIQEVKDKNSSVDYFKWTPEFKQEVKEIKKMKKKEVSKLSKSELQDLFKKATTIRTKMYKKYDERNELYTLLINIQLDKLSTILTLLHSLSYEIELCSSGTADDILIGLYEYGCQKDLCSHIL